MEAFPLISVIIPAYNVEAYVERCLTSIVTQDVSDIEVLVYDDGSSDRTYEILQRIENPRVHVYRGEANMGVVYARNFLLKRARGQFVAFQDADDWSRKDRLKEQMEFLLSRPGVGACGTQFVKMVDGRAIFHSAFPCDADSIRRAIPGETHFLPATLMVKRSILESTGFYNEFFGNDGYEDIYFAAKVILLYGFENIDLHAYCYNLNLSSLTKFGRVNIRSVYLGEVTRVLLQEYVVEGTNALESGDYDRLRDLEDACRKRTRPVTAFALFENVIGQLIFYRQYRLATRQIVSALFRSGRVFQSLRLLVYVVRKSISL